MKTIKEWLEELPEPYKTQAITNMENDVLYAGVYETTSLGEAILRAFVWEQTPEGGIYWNDLHEVILKNNHKALGVLKKKQEDMKTTREWLETLPEPYRSKAFANTNESQLVVPQHALTHALMGAFIWITSSEGEEFWADLVAMLEAGELTPTPQKKKGISKTFKQWLVGAKEQTGYRLLYEAGVPLGVISRMGRYMDLGSAKYTSAAQVIFNGFKWDQTPEGHEYWSAVAIELLNTKKSTDEKI